MGRNTSISFNPYFAGSSSGSVFTWLTGGIVYSVSILILLEVVLEDIITAECMSLHSRFNPYFAGSSSGRHIFFKNIIIQGLVSILILLEVVLEDFLSELTTGIDVCFNPYFAGSSSGRKAGDHSQHHIYWFQSLFCWK